MSSPCVPAHPSRRRWLQALAASACAPALAQTTPPGNDILVGRSMPLSGALAPFIAPVREGQDAAIADLNAQGGIGGRAVRLVTVDDGFAPDRTAQNTRALIEQEGVVALFGVFGTAQVMGILPYLAEKRTALVAVYSGSPELRAQPNPYLFTTSASYTDELAKLVRTLVSVESTRIAVVYESNVFGQQMLLLAQKAIAAEGASLLGSHSVQSSGQDAADAARALAKQQPQAVLMLASGPPVVAYVKAHRATMGVPIYTMSHSSGSAVLAALGEKARGLAVARTTPSPRQTTLQITREFQASMRRWGKRADYDRYIGYLDARVLIEGLRAAGRDASRSRLLTAMESLHRLDLGGHIYNFSAQNHHGSRYVDIAMVGADGNYLL